MPVTAQPPMGDLLRLHEALVAELRDLYMAGKQVVGFFSRLAAKPQSPSAGELIGAAQRDACNQLWRLEQAFAQLGEDLGGRHYRGMARLLDDRPVAGHTPSDATIAATTCRAARHLAALSATAAARARALGYLDVAALLDQCGHDAVTLARRSCEPRENQAWSPVVREPSEPAGAAAHADDL